MLCYVTLYIILYKATLCYINFHYNIVLYSNAGLQICRPDLIDPALLRPGRLDVLLYVGVAEDSHSKLKVLQALTRKFVMEEGIDLGIIAEKCPPTFTGADMYALSSDAWMTALKRTVAQVRPGNFESHKSYHHYVCQHFHF